MRNFSSIAALTAFMGLAVAKLPLHSISSSNASLPLHDPVYHLNATHFVDPATNKTYQHFDCDVHAGKASAHFNQTIRVLHTSHKTSGVGSRAALAKKAFTPITVNTYFHVISSTANAGTITPAMSAAQIQALNTAYNPVGVTFNLINTSWTTNDAWSVAAGSDMATLKAALRAGKYADLNLYFHTDLTGGILGTCTLPSAVPANANPSLYVSDGCNVQANTMPGGNIGGYNSGMTAVHETGHWLGLLHTFEGYSCDKSQPGDYIDDTPYESVSTSGCPSKPSKDSCPTVTGVDPIHNYMDYSTDACYTGFTPDQVKRIDNMWVQYRAGN